jgi:hypothetical protein
MFLNVSSEMLVDVKQAMTITGKSQYAINSFCQKHIKTKYIKKIRSKYFIDYTFLTQQYQVLNQKLNGSIVTESNDNKDSDDAIIKNLNEIIFFLKCQIDKKDEQLDKKDDQINNLIERNRETNFILQSLNKRLELTEGPKEKKKKNKK